LSAYLSAFPPVAVTLPWEQPSGRPTTCRLLLTTRDGTPVNGHYFNAGVWKPALRRAGVPATRENGMHALRHWFASALLDGGQSIKVVSEFLGHADEGFTLRTYIHLMPDSRERARGVIGAALQRTRGSDGPTTAQEAKG
jgi:integrase